jgi:hypothetical protein
LGKNSKKNKMNMKQTATEWLFEKLWETPKDKLTWNAILKVAEKMEQYQIEEAYEDGQSELSLKDKEQYYLETYDK